MKGSLTGLYHGLLAGHMDSWICQHMILQWPIPANWSKQIFGRIEFMDGLISKIQSWKTKYHVRLPIIYLAGQASVHILTTSVQCHIFAKPAWMSVGQSFRTLDCLEMAISQCSRRTVTILNGTLMAAYKTEWQLDCGPVLWMREGEMDWQTTDKPLLLGGDQLEKLKTVIHVLIFHKTSLGHLSVSASIIS